MTLNDFYLNLGHAVKYAPQSSNKYNELQAFAVLRYKQEFNDSNLAKTIHYKGTDYFYSKKWEALKFHPSKVSFEYPIMAIFPIVGKMENVFAAKNRERYTTLEMNFLYPNVRKAEQKFNCPPLLVEDIYKLMHELSLSVFEYLRGVICAIPDGSTAKVWRHKSLLDQAVVKTEITGYTELPGETNLYVKMLRQNNENLEVNFIDDIGKDMLCGVKYRLNFVEPNCEVDDKYNFANIANCCVQQDLNNASV